MRPAELIMLTLGLWVEALALWRNPPTLSKLFNSDDTADNTNGILDTPPQDNQQWAVMVWFSIAAVLYLIFTFTGLGTWEVDPLHPIVDGATTVIAVLAGLFIFFAGLWARNVLPQINEQTIFAVNLIVILGLFSPDSLIPVWPGALFVGLPSLAVLFLAVTNRTISDVAKAIYYLWYLILLLVLTAQDQFWDILNQQDVTLIEAFLTGAFLIFLGLHAVFFMRFFLITLSLIRPRNRRYVSYVMPEVFNDEQTPLWQFGLVTVLLIGVLGANAVYGFAEQSTLANVLTILIVQGMLSKHSFLRGFGRVV